MRQFLLAKVSPFVANYLSNVSSGMPQLNNLIAYILVINCKLQILVRVRVHENKSRITILPYVYTEFLEGIFVSFSLFGWAVMTWYPVRNAVHRKLSRRRQRFNCNRRFLSNRNGPRLFLLFPHAVCHYPDLAEEKILSNWMQMQNVSRFSSRTCVHVYIFKIHWFCLIQIGKTKITDTHARACMCDVCMYVLMNECMDE